jgi:hypothetical protein
VTERLAAARDGQQITLADVETLCAALRDRGAVDEMPMWAHAGWRTQCWMLYGILHREYLAGRGNPAPLPVAGSLAKEAAMTQPVEMPAFSACAGCGGMVIADADGHAKASWHSGTCPKLQEGTPVRLQLGDDMYMVGAISGTPEQVQAQLPGFLRQVADEMDNQAATHGAGNEQAGG